MNFVVDAQLPPSLCAWLAGRGHTAVHVTSLQPQGLPDAEIARWANRNRHIVISKDQDFVILASAGRCAAIRLCCGNLATTKLLTWLETRWSDIEARLIGGEPLIVVD